MATLKLSRYLAANVAMQEKKIRKHKARLTVLWNLRNIKNTGKLNTMKYDINQLHIDILGISKFRLTVKNILLTSQT